ncbi:hypothetical protein Tsubulata_051569 [Turnera subulata]|uniref:t-SNARE coiled-coil homology domain-containing protein n=1 Tax=Turnera subulata TaxID=218843 RepID=A0A9Q0GAH5_9ROSI|nr:hypothetical protein Tsubulata_051569 [Turnera subulata]
MELLNTKWMATVASIWIQCSTGATYTFGIYSSILKSSQGYDQSTLDAVSVFKDVGGNVGIISGLLYSFVTLERNRSRLGCFSGPWVVHLTGAIQWFVGYFVIWASVVGLIPRPPVPVMCLFMWMAAHAQTFYNTANVVTGVHNFRDYGGTIVGILKGFLGLRGAFLIQFYQTFRKGDPTTYILLLAVMPSLIPLLLMTSVRNYDSISKVDKSNLNAFSAVALLTGVYLMIIIVLENIFTFPSWVRIFTFTLLLLLVLSPLGIAIKAHREDSDIFAQPLLAESKLVSAVEAEDHTGNLELPSAEDQSMAACDDKELSGKADKNVLQAMCTVDFWLLFVPMFCALGTGLATINNMSQIGESLGYSIIERNSLVSLCCIWNFLGRFGAGFVSDIFLHRGGWPRPVFIAITLVIMTIGHLVIASGIYKSLYLGSILVIVSYGSQWSLMPTITAEIFGVQHMATIYNTIAIASPLGSYVFSVRVIGYIYDRVSNGEGNTCFGTRCFMLSFITMASVSAVGALVALVLSFRRKRFYQIMNTKWAATVASIWIQTCSGAYTFGIYSPVLKSSQGYDQSTLDLVSVAPRQENYSQSRAVALHNVESTITKLSGIFTHLATMVAQQGELAIRAHREDSSRLLQASLIIEKDYQSNASIVESVDYEKLPSEEGQSAGATFDGERYLSDEETMNIWQALRSGNFWLLFIAMFCAFGTVIAVMGNLSQIGESLGYTTAEINSMISLASIWTFLGRIGAGIVSDMFMHRYGWTRPMFIVVIFAILIIGQIVIILNFSKSLFLGSVLVGICDGSLWLLMTITTSELFGLQHMGTIFNTISISAPVGSYIFSVKIVGYFYDMVADSETHVCLGTRCFMLSLLIMASVTFCGALVALALFFRTRRFYQQSVIKRLQHS